jgi:hypothetical protein
VPPAAATIESASLTALRAALSEADDADLLATMLRVGDAQLTRAGRMCLLLTLSRFAPNDALVEALELLAWEN